MKKLFIAVLLLAGIQSWAQETGQSGSYLDYSWKKVATQMPADWYGSADAKKVAETVLFCQQEIGGWAKNKPYHHSLSAKDSAEVIANKNGIAATIDNGATTMEMIFLANVYPQQKDLRYSAAFEKGLDYLLKAQYPNGGWPQFFPFRTGNSVSYAAHITYNDNAMVNVLQLLRAVVASAAPYSALSLSAAVKEKAARAIEKGIECILKTQIRVNGKPTVWCAQHDEVTLLPANARAYELASFSGAESVGIIQFLMEIEQPSPEIIASIQAALQWLEEHKITGIKLVNQPGADGKRNMVVVEDPNAPPLLARFYDLETGLPFFCDRDGIKKNTLAEIGAERRNGYSWYSDAYLSLQKKYNNWKKKQNL
jgi:pectinesterase